MSDTRNTGTLFYDAEHGRFDNAENREVIPRRLVYAMFGLAGLTLFLTAGAVLSGRTPSGIAAEEPAVATHVVTLAGVGDAIHVTNAEGIVIADRDNGAFIAVVRNGLDHARRKHRITGNPPVEITEWQSGRMTLLDPATGWEMEISSFGRGNLMHFRALLAEQK